MPTSARGASGGPADTAAGHVLVIEDDAPLRAAMDGLFRSVGLQVTMFAATADFLRSKLPDAPSCLVPEVRPPGAIGRVFLTQPAALNFHTPFIVLTPHPEFT